MRWATLVVAVLCLVVLFPGLGRPGFVDHREARDAAVAREILQRREFLTPLYGGDAHFEKPFIAYLPEMLAQHLTPGSPLGPRAVKALLAVGLVLVTASIGAQHFGARAGACAGGVLATTLGLTLAVRSDGTQLLCTLLGWVGCSGLADALFGRQRGRELRLVVTYAALAATLVAGGLLPALWPLGGLALYLRLSRMHDGWRRVRPLPGFALMIGLALPWYGAMIERHGAEFIARMPFFPYGVEARGPWYAGPLIALAFLVVGAFPWSTLLPGALSHAATWWRFARRTPRHVAPAKRSTNDARTAAESPRRDPLVPGGADTDRPASDPLARELREETAAHFFIAALGAALIPLVLYPGPPLPAALPALPAVALLCGRFLDHLFEDPRRVAEPLTTAIRMLALAGTVAAILLVLLSPRLRDAEHELRLLGASLLLASWAPLLAQLVGRTRIAGALLALPVAIGAPLVGLRLLPALEDYLNSASAAAAFDGIAPPRAPLLLIEPAPPSLRLGLDRNLVVAPALAEALAKFPASDGRTYLAFRPAREREVARTARTPLEILLRTPSLVLARVEPGLEQPHLQGLGSSFGVDPARP